MYSELLTSKKYEYKNYNYDKDIIDEYICEISLGNKEALSSLYEYTKDSVYGFALSILKNIHEAEDILHDVYIKIYNNAENYAPNGKGLSWILTITKNLSLMKLRSKKHNINIDEIIEVLPEKSNSIDLETKLLLTAAFKYISDEERNILFLHSISGYKHREIAKLLDIPLSTVLSKYNRTIKKIRNFMSEENVK